MFASLYSDYARRSSRTSSASRRRRSPRTTSSTSRALSVQVGVFWDRFGYIEPYDTYIFGRTHQGGAKVAYALPGGGRVQAGIGFHEADLQQNQGTTPIAHVVGAYPVGPVEVGAYLLRTWTRDKRQLARSRTARCTSPASTRSKAARRPRHRVPRVRLLQHGQRALPRARARGHALDRRPRHHRELPRPRLQRRRHRPHVHVAGDVKVAAHRPDRRARVRHGDVGALAAGRRDGRDREQGSPALPQVGRRAELRGDAQACACRRATTA